MLSTISIEVGMPGFWQIGSDRYPVIITRVYSQKKIEIAMIDFRIDSSNYGAEFFPEIKHSHKLLTLRKNGRFVEAGQPMKYSGGYRFGQFSAYRDPSF